MEERIARLRRREAELGGEEAGAGEDVARVTALLQKLAGGEPRAAAAAGARAPQKELR